jgi:hypothetical protein
MSLSPFCFFSHVYVELDRFDNRIFSGMAASVDRNTKIGIVKEGSKEGRGAVLSVFGVPDLRRNKRKPSFHQCFALRQGIYRHFYPTFHVVNMRGVYGKNVSGFTAGI